MCHLSYINCQFVRHIVTTLIPCDCRYSREKTIYKLDNLSVHIEQGKNKNFCGRVVVVGFFFFLIMINFYSCSYNKDINSHLFVQNFVK